MSDEVKQDEKNGEWQMPEPIFRSSEGHTPRSPIEDDLPTDPGFDEAPTEITNKPEETDAPQSVRAASKTKVRHQKKKKKKGCLKSVAMMILILVASVALIVFTVIYFIFYSGPRSGPF